MANDPVIHLPTNASALQRLLAMTEAWSINHIDINIDVLWDPAQCPVELLPYLAWALSVDHWQDDWPEETKRTVVAASPYVHRVKGTRAAVESALSAIGIKAKIVEWWQETPPARRGTFSITVYVNHHIYADDPVFLNEKIQRDAIKFVKAAKPKSRVFNFIIGANFSAQIGVGNSMALMAIQRETIEADRDSGFSAQIGVGNSMALMAIQQTTIEAGRDSAFINEIGVANAFSILQIHQALFAEE